MYVNVLYLRKGLLCGRFEDEFGKPFPYVLVHHKHLEMGIRSFIIEGLLCIIFQGHRFLFNDALVSNGNIPVYIFDPRCSLHSIPQGGSDWDIWMQCGMLGHDVSQPFVKDLVCLRESL